MGLASLGVRGAATARPSVIAITPPFGGRAWIIADGPR